MLQNLTEKPHEHVTYHVSPVEICQIKQNPTLQWDNETILTWSCGQMIFSMWKTVHLHVYL